MNIIKMNKLNYKYQNKIIFDNLDLEIKEGSFTFLVGPCGCGKTTLFKILLGLIDTESNIEICEKDLKDNLQDIRKSIGVVFENPSNTFIGDTVFDEIAFSLENMNINKEEINNKVLEISKELNIEHLLDYSPYSLSGGEQEIISLAAALVIEPKILLIDESLSMIDGKDKQQILKKLKKLNREKKMTILFATQDMEDTIYGKNIIILKDGKIVLNEKIKDAYLNEKVFKECNLKIPFMADLSIKLKYYGLVDEIILDMDKMVNKLWK